MSTRALRPVALFAALALAPVTACDSGGSDFDETSPSGAVSGGASIATASSVPGPPTPPTSSSTTVAVPSSSAPTKGCMTSDLKATAQDKKIQPFGKTRYLPIVVSNTGTVECPLPEYPVVSILAENGKRLAVPTDPQPLRAGKAATSIAPGGSVSFEIAWVTVPSLPDDDPAQTCLSPSAIIIGFASGGPIQARTNSVTACDRGALSVYPFREV